MIDPNFIENYSQEVSGPSEHQITSKNIFLDIFG